MNVLLNDVHIFTLKGLGAWRVDREHKRVM